nr:hypothetical protein [Tanacetum cinerariifolium]
KTPISKLNGQHGTKLLRVLMSRYQLDRSEHLIIFDIVPVHLISPCFGVDAAMQIKEKHQVFTAASEDISAAGYCCQIVLLRGMMLLSQLKTVVRTKLFRTVFEQPKKLKAMMSECTAAKTFCGNDPYPYLC